MKAVDCATKLTATTAHALRADGVDIVCRYLGNSWKSFDKAEAEAISDAALKIVSIWETNPTSDGYFTAEQGKQDALEAIKYAKQVGQPEGTPIYFAVDYPGGNTNLGQIESYFKSIRKHLDGYKVGGYGSYEVVKYLYEKGVIDYPWQTLAWSNGQVYDKAVLYQAKNGQTEAGVMVDIDKVLSNPGAWSLSAQSKPSDEHRIDRKPCVVTGDVWLHSAPNFDKSTEIRVLHKGEQYYVYGEKNGMYDLGAHQYASKKYIKIVSEHQASHPEPYTVKRGNVLSVIASKHGTTVAELMKLNPQIGDPDKIYPGEKILLPDGAHTHPETPEDKYYDAASGDVLSRIADRFHTTVGHLLRINPKITNKNKIYPGERIRVK